MTFQDRSAGSELVSTSGRETFPLVSVITPTLNAARYLGATIDSVKSQDYPFVEHIVVDGGSTDETVEIVHRASDVVLVRRAVSDQAQSVNLGFQIARGDVIGWLNADDLYLEGAIGRAVQALHERPDAAMVYANYLEIDSTGHETQRLPSKPFDLKSMLNEGNQIPHPTVFVRRLILEELGFVSPEFQYAMDYDLWLRIAKRHPVAYIDDYWAAFRIHGESKSGRHSPQFYSEMRAISRANGGSFFSRIWVTHHVGRLRRVVGAIVHGDGNYFRAKTERQVLPGRRLRRRTTPTRAHHR
jgi:glycosyltransferase involved in cell wall biosynthesis